MDYIRQLNAFSNLSAGILSSNEVNVYLRLFWWNNRCCWTEWFETTDSRLQIETGIVSPNTIRAIRNSLRQKGFIDFIPGKRRSPTKYKIIDLSQVTERLPSSFMSTIDINTDINTDIKTDIKPDINADIKTDSIYKHKRKTETKTKKEKGKEKACAFSFDSYTQNAELLEALEGFVEMRKKAKAPLTERAIKLALKELDKLAGTDEKKIAVVNQSVVNGWKGFYPLKKGGGNYGTGIIQGHMAGDDAEKSPYAAYFDGDAGTGAGDIAGGTTTESRDPPSDLRLAGTGAFGCGASPGGGGGAYQTRA